MVICLIDMWVNKAFNFHLFDCMFQGEERALIYHMYSVKCREREVLALKVKLTLKMYEKQVLKIKRRAG